MPGPRFKLGCLVATPAALEAIPPEDVALSLKRHLTGDWGDVDEHDRKENDYALGKHLRIFSAYTASNGTKFWIITEADRSSTTVLLPDDY